MFMIWWECISIRGVSWLNQYSSTESSLYRSLCNVITWTKDGRIIDFMVVQLADFDIVANSRVQRTRSIKDTLALPYRNYCTITQTPSVTTEPHQVERTCLQSNFQACMILMFTRRRENLLCVLGLLSSIIMLRNNGWYVGVVFAIS